MNQSIDQVARTKLAELARQLAVGHITNDEFEDAVSSGAEEALNEILYLGLWPLYSDLSEHKLVADHKLTSEGRAWVARIVLFLRSGLPYRWPRVPGVVSLLSVFTLGWLARSWRRKHAFGGEEAAWPFFTNTEYEQALSCPVYLSGRHVA